MIMVSDKGLAEAERVNKELLRLHDWSGMKIRMSHCIEFSPLEGRIIIGNKNQRALNYVNSGTIIQAYLSVSVSVLYES